MWLFLVLFSALSLGIYNIFQKISLKDNAVIPVLFASMVGSAVIVSPFLLLSIFSPQLIEGSLFFVPSVNLHTHVLIFIKALIICFSWLFAYSSMKHLPLTIISPIKSSQPIWTVLGAVLIFSERLNAYQTLGVIVILCFFILFSMAGKREGISFKSNKWVWFMVIATLFGASSGMFDKYLLKKYDHMAVQVFFTYYQVLIMVVVLSFVWYPQRKKSTPFQWRWSIALISVFLLFSDFLYFYALSLPDSLLAIISPLRRVGMLVPFFWGVFFLKEKNLKWKLISLIGILIGGSLLFFSS